MHCISFHAYSISTIKSKFIFLDIQLRHAIAALPYDEQFQQHTHCAQTHMHRRLAEPQKYNFIVFLFFIFDLFSFTSSMKYSGGHVSIRNTIYLQNAEHRWAWSGEVTTARDTLLNDNNWFIRILPEQFSFISTDYYCIARSQPFNSKVVKNEHSVRVECARCHTTYVNIAQHTLVDSNIWIRTKFLIVSWNSHSKRFFFLFNKLHYLWNN